MLIIPRTLALEVPEEAPNKPILNKYHMRPYMLYKWHHSNFMASFLSKKDLQNYKTCI